MRTIKLYKNLVILLFFALSVISCEKKIDSDGLSKTTFFPEFQVTGDGLILLNTGEAFTEPGITALENGEEIPVTTSVIGTVQSYSGTTVDTELENEYIMTYSATNSDGFIGIASRTVWVATTGDLVNSIEGLYTATVVRNGVSLPAYINMKYLLIYKTGVNTYEISDGIGGYYDLGRAYGPGYRAVPAEVTAVDIATNSFTYGGAFGVGAFGGSAQMSGFTVDAGAKKITFTTVWDAGYTFVVTLTQVTI